MRYMGAFLVFCSIVGAGTGYVKQKKKHMEALEEMCLALKLMEGELATSNSSLEQIFEVLAERTSGPSADFFERLRTDLDRLYENEFSQIWQEGVYACLSLLSRDELKELISLGNIIGRYELDKQLNAIRSAACFLSSSLLDARAAYPGEKKLGLGAGAAAALLTVLSLI